MLAGAYRAQHPLDRPVHVLEQERIMQPRLEIRPEKDIPLRLPDPSNGEQTLQQIAVRIDRQ